MAISINPIKVENYGIYYYSEPIAINTLSYINELIIENNYEDVFISTLEGDLFFKDKIVNLKDLKYIRVATLADLDSKSKGYSITLSSRQTKEKLTLNGTVKIAKNITFRPNYSIESSSNCSPVFNDNTVKFNINQNKFSDCSFSFASDIDMNDEASAGVSEYTIKSKNNINPGTDNTLLNNSLLMTFGISSNTGSFSLGLTNPNASGHPLGDYGFSRENEYIVSFTKNAVINNRNNPITFIGDLNFKNTPPVITPKRIQEAYIDPYHLNTLIAYDFELNIDAEQRQFRFGFDNAFNLPVSLNTIVPRAMKLPFEDSYSSLEVKVSAIGLVKSPSHYTLKLVIEPKLLNNRTLRTFNTNIPAKLEIRGLVHNFNIPVRFRG